MKLKVLIPIFLSLCLLQACAQSPESQKTAEVNLVLTDDLVDQGAERTELYFPLIDELRIGLVVNQSSLVGGRHLVDTLTSMSFDVKKIFALEHGIRGKADAGAIIKDGRDERSGLPIVSIYGKQKSPTKEMLEDIDVVIFDIQDVGVRFYTYISSLHYIMKSCAEYGKKLIVLDRPNPNGFYVDGPVLKRDFQSFVGMHEIPIVHGMTIGEYAKMIAGENHIEADNDLDLIVIPCHGYAHKFTFDLPTRPSPNLPNLKSILLYPSLCLFEATNVSIGRGTDKQFQQFGFPQNALGHHSFMPKPNIGSKKPKHNGLACSGTDLSKIEISDIMQKGLDLSYLLNYNQHAEGFEVDRPAFFDKLAGSDQLRQQLQNKQTLDQIRASWQDELNKFKLIRAKYLLYP